MLGISMACNLSPQRSHKFTHKASGRTRQICRLIRRRSKTALALATPRVETLSIRAASAWETRGLSVCKFAERYTAPPRGMFAILAATTCRWLSSKCLRRRFIDTTNATGSSL